MTKTLVIVPVLALLAACGQSSGGSNGGKAGTKVSYAGQSIDIPAPGTANPAASALSGMPPMAAMPDMPAPIGANPLIGSWVPASAEHEDCEARLVFAPTQVTVYPNGGGAPQTDQVTYQNEGASTVYVTSRDRSEKEKVTIGAGGEIVSDDCTYKRDTTA